MASTSPSPSSIPPPDSPSPTTSQPNQTTEAPPPATPSTSAPPPATLPPPLPAAPPPSPPQSPPPAPPTSPPPVPPATPPTLPPPVNATPPPSANPPPAPTLSPPPPPTEGSPPPAASTTPPTPPAVTPPPPPPRTPILSPPPLPRDIPPPPAVDPSPPNQQLTPPPLSAPPSNTSNSPPSTSSPSGTPTTSQPAPFPTEKPTARSTDSSRNDTENSRSGGGLGSGGVAAIGLVVGFAILGLLVMAVLYRRRKKKRTPPNADYMMPSPFSSSQNSDSLFLRPQQSSHPAAAVSPPGSDFVYSPEHGGAANLRACFTYEELAEATGGFSESNVLGEGGFGCVYKGFLADGKEVAIKRLKAGGGQGEREFRAEVEIIGRVHHRHLVSLVGYCISGHQRLLVYQYVPNDTLHYHLHGECRPVMDWATRIKVAAGAARGLAYLHEDCHPRIIHRDIKSSNILLDNNFDAQVADFGLAKLAMDSDTHVTTRVMGTFGYMAPEYASSGKLTEKSDVFSFGVLLLELITGRKPVDTSQPLGDESLVQWGRPLLSQALNKRDFEELVDPRLGKSYVEAEMLRMMEAAAACIRHLAPKRPRMSQVVRALDSLVEFTTDLSNGMKPGQSEVIDSREQSALIRLFQRMAFGGQDESSEYYNNSQSSWRS